jgi:photosystem II stability/assembly factor-like uncharacterized protein
LRSRVNRHSFWGLVSLLMFAFIAAAMPGEARAVAGISPGGWTSIGPDNLGGRLTSIVIHSTEPNKMWVGAAGGGIWKTTDGGANWSPVHDPMSSLGGLRMVTAGVNPNILYASGGVPGIYKSTDGGTTWALLPGTAASSPDFYTFNGAAKVAVHPSNDNILLAQAGYAIYRSVDGGASWSRWISGGVVDFAFDPMDGNRVYTGNYSINGPNWTSLTGAPNIFKVAWSRQAGLVYRSSGQHAPHSTFNQGILSGTVSRSLDYGVTWTDLAVLNHLGLYAMQHNAIWVDPTDSNHVIVGGQNLYRTTNGGANWTQISNGTLAGSVPSGQHAIVSSPGYNGTTNRTIFIAGAGGVYKATDIQAVTAPNVGWTPLNNGLAAMQFHSGAGHAGNNGRIIGGTDGSGSLVYSGSGKAWSKFADGNGGHVAIDQTDGNYVYGAEFLSRLYRSTTGAAPASFIYDGITDAGIQGNLVSPFVLDPNNVNVMLIAGNSLWRSPNVKAPAPSWSKIWNGGDRLALGNEGWFISQVAIAPGNSDLIWFSQYNGTLFKLSNAGLFKAWDPQIDLENPTNAWSILIDKDDHNIVYIGRYSSLLRTLDGGATWTTLNYGGTKPRIRTIQRHPLHPYYLYLGTDNGIYASENAGASWSPANEGPADVRVNQLFWKNNSTLVAATMGRGMFTSSITVQPNVLAILKGGSGTGFVSSAPAGIFCGATCSASYATGTTVTLTASAHQGSYFTGWGGACSGNGTSSTCVVAMNDVRSATAIFKLPYTLSVTKSGAGGGTVTSSPAGINCGNSCGAPFAPDTLVTLTATPNAFSVFAGWSGACSGTSTCQVSMTQARSVYATFNPSAYYLLSVVLDGSGIGTVASSPSGINCGSTCSASFANGTNVTLTPTAPSGSYFAGWTGACTGSGACTVSMTQARNVTAIFTAGVPNYTLTVFKSGTGSGPVTSSPSGITCGSTCSASYPSGTSVTLTATPNSGSVFAGWSGACSGTSATCVVNVNAAKNVTATFNAGATPYGLTITKAGAGSGPVTSSPSGIACGSICSANYSSETTVTLTATANSGSVFAGWSGACSGNASTCVVTMNAAKSVTATFNTATPSYTLTVSKAGSGSGPVTSNPGGIACGSICSASYASNTVVTLTATPNSGSEFGGWSGACWGTSTCVVSMNAAKNVTATFYKAGTSHPLTVSKAGSGSGPVTSNPAAIFCGSICGAIFETGTTVTLTATPNSGSEFGGWSGACWGTSTCVLSMNAAKNVTATYYPAGTGRALTVSKAGSGSGPVTSSPQGIFCGSICGANYPMNTNVTLTASPNSGAVFVGWSGGCTGSLNTCVVTMDVAKNVTATFTQASGAAR